MEKAPLEGIPKKIFQQICTSICGGQHDLSTQRDLINLSESCNRLAPAVRYVILQHVIVDITRLGSLLQYYLKYRSDQPQGSCILEITSGPGLPVANIPDGRLISECEDRIFEHQSEVQSQAEWLNDLVTGNLEAFLGLVLMQPPGLTDLRLGRSRLHAFPLLNRLFNEPQVVIRRGGYDWQRPSPWSRNYPDEIFDWIAPRLKALELPGHWDMVHAYDPTGVRLMPRVATLKAFTCLERLSAPYDALISLPGLHVPSGAVPHVPIENFPPTLQILVITDASRNHRMFQFLEQLLVKRKEKGMLPVLSRVEVCSGNRLEPSLGNNAEEDTIVANGRRLGIEICFG